MIQFDNEINGFRCVIARMPLGHLCGYVALKPNHPLYGKEYGGTYDEKTDEYTGSPVDVLDVHGGITYSEAELLDTKSVDTWWLGFDCAHGQDFKDIPGLLRGYPNKTIGYVYDQLDDLTKQLGAMV